MDVFMVILLFGGYGGGRRCVVFDLWLCLQFIENALARFAGEEGIAAGGLKHFSMAFIST
jgi:uncharacterized membrane protein YccF (DUF307 family)